MFEISDLKSKKLPELQEIAQGLNVAKFKTLKKLDLVYQILDVQASNPKIVQERTEATTEESSTAKPKRSRIIKSKPKETAAKAPGKPEMKSVAPTEKSSTPEETTTAVEDKKEDTKRERKPRQHNNPVQAKKEFQKGAPQQNASQQNTSQPNKPQHKKIHTIKKVMLTKTTAILIRT